MSFGQPAPPSRAPVTVLAAGDTSSRASGPLTSNSSSEERLEPPYLLGCYSWTSKGGGQLLDESFRFRSDGSYEYTGRHSPATQGTWSVTADATYQNYWSLLLKPAPLSAVVSDFRLNRDGLRVWWSREHQRSDLGQCEESTASKRT
jgi:hypothetical protein